MEEKKVTLSKEYLEKDMNSSPVLSDFCESLNLIGDKISNLFLKKNLSKLTSLTSKIEKTNDVHKKKIIYFCKNSDLTEFFDFLKTLSKNEMENINEEFFYITARKIAKNYSLEDYSEFLFLMSKNYGYNPQFFKCFFSYKKDKKNFDDLLALLKNWQNEEIEEKEEVLKNFLLLAIEKLSLYNSEIDTVLSILKENYDENLENDLSKMILAVTQSIMKKEKNFYDLEKIFKTFEDIKFDFTIFICNKILDIIQKNTKETKFFEFIINFMKKKNIKFDIVTYNQILNFYSSNNNFDLALKLFKNLEKEKIKPDDFTFSIMINGIKNMLQPDLKLAKEFFEIYQSQNKVKNIIIYNSILDVLISLSNLSDAEKIFEQISNDEFLCADEITFNIIIKGCCKNKDYDNAIKYLNLMKKQLLKPNKITFNSILDIAVKMEKMPEALRLLEEMKKDHINPDSFTYSIILNGLKLNNSSQRLVKLSLENLLTVLKNKEFIKDEILFNTIFELCLKYKLGFFLTKYYELMIDSNIRPSGTTCSVLIKTFSILKDFKSAFKIFEKMITTNMLINDVTYGYILEACGQEGQMDIALKIYKTLKQNEMNLNTIVFTTIIKGFMKSGFYQQAADFFEEIKHHKNLTGMIITYNCALDVYGRLRKTKKLVDLFEEIDSLYKADVISYSTVIKHLCKMENKKNEKKIALDLLKRMIDSDILKDISVVNLFLENCSNKEDFKLGISAYRYTLLKNMIPNDITFGIMIKIFGLSRELYKAFDLLDLLKVYNLKPSIITFTNLIHISFYNRNVRKAELAYTLLRKEGLEGDCLLYSKIIDGLVRFREISRVPRYVNFAIRDKCSLKKHTIENILKYFNNDEMREKISIIKSFYKRYDPKKSKNFTNRKQNDYNIQNPKKFKKIYHEKNVQRNEEINKKNNESFKNNNIGNNFRKNSYGDNKGGFRKNIYGDNKGNNYGNNNRNNYHQKNTNSYNQQKKGNYNQEGNNVNEGVKKPLKMFNFRKRLSD